MPIGTKFRNTSVGAGSAAEQVVATNGTIIVPQGFILKLTDYIVSVKGTMTVRVREGGLAGAIVTEWAFPEAALVGGDIVAALEFKAVSADITLVVTEEGQFRNVCLLAGDMTSINP